MIRRWKLKNVTVLVLVISLLVGLFAFPVNAVGTNSYDFPNFTEADSMAFVEEHNIEIPLNLQQSDYLSAFTQKLVLQSYESPNIPFLFNYLPTQEYAESIREAVRMYIDLAAVPSVATTTATTLQYSKVMDSNGNWVTSGGYHNPKWHNYNCYAYSINRIEQPQYYTSDNFLQYQPGDMSDQGSFNMCSTINELAELVCTDLTAMGYSNISTSLTIPTINSSQELICVRMLKDVDYHFMRYDLATDAWYHKPSSTAVLKYNYTPSNSYIWNNERSILGYVFPATIEYNSNIVFITYSKNQININCNATTTDLIDIQASKDVMYELNFSSNGTCAITLDSATLIEYEIYNEDFDIVSSGSGGYIEESLAGTADSKYYLRMNFAVTSFSGVVNISASHSHSHSYTDRYVWKSYTQHDCFCDCNQIITSSHVIQQGSGTGYATCLLCNGLASIGNLNSVVADLPHTQNGSYILPNGTVVLVEEDIEAYMSGSLIFSNGETE